MRDARTAGSGAGLRLWPDAQLAEQQLVGRVLSWIEVNGAPGLSATTSAWLDVVVAALPTTAPLASTASNRPGCAPAYTVSSARMAGNGSVMSALHPSDSPVSPGAVGGP
jgi:hypothetical protein